MTEKDDVVKPQSLPPKLKDPDKFIISCNIGRVNIPHALCDLGSSINVMPLKTVKELKVGGITQSNMTLLELTRLLFSDVLVHANDLVFPANFVVLDIK